MTMDTGQEPIWRVGRANGPAVEDTFGPTSIGGNNRIKRVYVTLMDGTETYVDIPFANFNAAAVAAAIEKHVADMVDVLGLKGTSF